MGAASDYLRGLSKTHLEADEVAVFATKLALEEGKEEQQAALDHLLRTKELTPDQVIQLARSATVSHVVGLQHSLVRYARSKRYEAARQAAVEEPGWKLALMIIADALA